MDKSKRQLFINKPGQLLKKIFPPINLKQSVSNDTPTIGLVVATRGSIPYIHLHLESRRRNYPDIPLLIHDDSSMKSDALKALCKEYGALYYTTTEPLGQNVGDLSSYLHGMIWAHKYNFTILVKMSRRFIPLYNWVPGLLSLYNDTPYPTYSNVCNTQNLMFRTECVAFLVEKWINSNAVDDLKRQVAGKQPDDVLIETVLYNLTKNVNAYYQMGTEDNEYGAWNILNTDRKIKLPYVLWHHNCSPEEYCRAMLQYGFLYKIEDWYDSL